MKVYITDLESYNNGHLVGEWYELPMGEEELQEAIVEVLRNGQATSKDAHIHEEYFITDFECDYMKIDEHDSLNTLNTIAQTMSELEEDQKKAVKILLDAGIATDIDDAVEKIDNLICTGETTMEDVAYNYIEETGALQNMPQNLQYYFDYEKLGRDMDLEGSFYVGEDDLIWEYVG
jgi:antirestriction protein